MTRKRNTSNNKVALLATGDEIIHGDILNTNSQIIAQQLFDYGIPIGMHMVVADNINEITQAIDYLLQRHRALIIMGGLGPTSDDLTRFALSQALNRPLIFDETSWHAIEDRFKKLKYHILPENNRQQALFPEGAMIIPNSIGTANGCIISLSSQTIFMLPGPPIECLPMMEPVILPTLKQNGFQEISFYDHWLLFGVSEGEIAEKLDAIAKPYDCITGYRVCYPYIEFKLHSNNQKDFTTLVPIIEKTIMPYLMHDGKQSASILLQKKLCELDFNLYIDDAATGGLLENILKTPENQAYLHFTQQIDKSASSYIIIKGLNEFWQNKTANNTKITILFSHNHFQQEITEEIPFRHDRIKQYAVEWICWKIDTLLISSSSMQGKHSRP